MTAIAGGVEKPYSKVVAGVNIRCVEQRCQCCAVSAAGVIAKRKKEAAMACLIDGRRAGGRCMMMTPISD